MKSKFGWLLGLVAGVVLLVLLTPENQQQVLAQSVKTNGVFGGLLLGGTTNIISDNGTTLTRNGSAISGGGGFAGAVSNSVAQSGLLAVDATKTNGVAATAAMVQSAIGSTLYIPFITSGQFQQYQDTVTHSGTVTLDFSSTNVHSLSLTGNVTFAFSNLATNRTCRLRVMNPTATNCLVTFPAGALTNFLGGAPSSLAAGHRAVWSMESWGTTDADVDNAWVATQ